MTSIKFNDEIIDIDKDYINNINIYDLNIFTNENFNFIRDNSNYYKNINIKDFDYTSYTSKTNNYKKLYKNYIYINKLNNYNKNLLSSIYNTDNIIFNKNEDNIINSISLHYKNNHINNFHHYLYDIENKNIEIRLINQYLYYMNIHFTNKFKLLENELRKQKDKNKILENYLNDINELNNLNNIKTQETDIRYLKYKNNSQEDKLIYLENNIINLNKKIFNLYIISLLLLLFIFIK